MKEYTLNNWADYWAIFFELIELLKKDNQVKIISEFTEAKKYFNGLTDGCNDFKDAFEKSLQSNRRLMTNEQTEIADFLLANMNNALTNRPYKK